MNADIITYGARWHWAGSQFEHSAPLNSPNADTAGQEANYGVSESLSYTYTAVNALASIADSLDSSYSCSVACDANGNITAVSEYKLQFPYVAVLPTAFEYDALNRLTRVSTSQVKSAGGTQYTEYTNRRHRYDGLGRVADSALTQWTSGNEPTPAYRDHLYAGARHIGNADGGSTYGARWHWAGAQFEYASPLNSPNADTAGQKGYNIARAQSPQQATWATPTAAGDNKLLYGQGRPMAKSASGAGAAYSTGTLSKDQGSGSVQVSSRLFFDGTVAGGGTANDLSRMTDAREKGRIGIFGSALSYAGSYGRVTSESLGRDLNPLGRGDGTYYAGGNFSIRYMYPPLPFNGNRSGTGNGVDDTSGPGQSTPQPQVPTPSPGGLGGGNTNTGKSIEGCKDLDPCSYAWVEKEMKSHVNCQSQLGMVNNPTAGLAVKCCNSCCFDTVDCVYPETLTTPYYGCCGNLGLDCQELWKSGEVGNKDAFGQKAVGLCKSCGSGSGDSNGSGAGGGTGGGCKGCGGGYGSNGIGYSGYRSPGKTKGGGSLANSMPPKKTDLLCGDHFTTVLSMLKDAVNNSTAYNACCCGSPNGCPTCEKLKDSLNSCSVNIVEAGLNDTDCVDNDNNPRYVHTDCTLGPGLKICCQNFGPPYTFQGIMGTSNDYCAAGMVIAIELLKCNNEYDGTKTKCIKDIIRVVNCLCQYFM